MRTRRTRRVFAVMLAATLLLGACDDADDGATDPDAEADTGAEGDEGEAAGDELTVTAVDYAYPDLPDEITAGTTVVMQNDSEGEVHEILAFRLNDGEERTIEELMQLPEEEIGQIMEMRGVALAPPGALSNELPAPPLVLEQPGRYVFACFIPTGAPPDEVMTAVQEFLQSGDQSGAPAYPDTGPPHAANGMVAEVRVTGGS